MLDISNFKRRNSSASKLIFARKSIVCKPAKLNIENSEEIDENSQENIPPKLNSLPKMIIKASNDLELNERINWITDFIKNNKHIAIKSVDNESNSKFEEIKKSIQRIRQLKQKLLTEIADATQQFEINQEDINRKIILKEKNILKLTSNKEHTIEYAKSSKFRIKFFKDLTNLEILDIQTNPKIFTLQISHEHHYLRFQLREEDHNFEYHLIDTTIPEGHLPDAFCNDIIFEKDQLKIFYVEIMELIYSFE